MYQTYQELVAQIKPAVTEVSVAELNESLSDDVLLIDVREQNECNEGIIPKAINIPRGLLEGNIAQTCETFNSKTVDKPAIYLICRSGMRSILAAESLQKMGYKNIYSVKGGMLDWQAKGFDLTY